MDEILRSAGVTDVYVCGIATDVCVGNRFYNESEMFTRSDILMPTIKIM